MRKVLAILSLLLVLVFTAQSIPTSSYEQELVYTTTLYLLAITEDDGGTVVRTILNVYYPGSGKVITRVDSGSIAENTRISIEYALILASLLSGISYKLYDYELVFPAGTRLEGASATLAFALGFLSFFTNTSNRGEIGVTGVIAPNTVVGLVEGLNEKYEAGIVYGLDEIIGPYAINMINRTRYKPAITVFDAYREYTGSSIYRIEDGTASLHRFVEIMDHIFKYSFEFFDKEIESIIKKMNEMGISGFSDTSGYTYYLLAKKYGEKGKYYTAASYAFRSYIELYEYYLAELQHRDPAEVSEELDKLDKQIYKEISRLRIELFNYTRVVNANNLWNLNVLLNSYIRYWYALNAYIEGTR
ncbi:MAG: S16 family serine protease, partial [Thermoprotei archaeon]